MTEIMAKVLIAIITKLITESFLAKLLIEILRSWAKTTANQLDDKVVEAMAAALDVDHESLKDMAGKI